MLERFKENRDNLLMAIGDQQCVAHDKDLSEALADIVVLKQVEAGDVLITQEGEENDMFLILAGRASVRVNGVDIATRHAGEHLGEMAALHPSSKRSATVVAAESMVVASITEPQLTELATRFPALWRRLAIELAQRIRQRGILVRKRNETPIVFIGSTVESLAVAKEIQAGLTYSPLVARLWTTGVFTPSVTTIDALKAAIGEADIGVIVCAGDDVVITRDEETPAPRDNVIFELGMCVGHLGSRRTLLVRPRDKDLKIPTDLLGVTPISYKHDDPANLESHIGPVCTAIAKVVAELGPR